MNDAFTDLEARRREIPALLRNLSTQIGRVDVKMAALQAQRDALVEQRGALRAEQAQLGAA